MGAVKGAEMNENKTAGTLCLDDYKNALRGEICDLIGHYPDDAELALMEQYAADYTADQVNTNKQPNLCGLCSALLDCKLENFQPCAECGGYFLPDEMNGYHCTKCKPFYDPDFEWKLERDYKMNETLDN